MSKLNEFEGAAYSKLHVIIRGRRASSCFAFLGSSTVSLYTLILFTGLYSLSYYRFFYENKTARGSLYARRRTFAVLFEAAHSLRPQEQSSLCRQLVPLAQNSTAHHAHFHASWHARRRCCHTKPASFVVRQQTSIVAADGMSPSTSRERCTQVDSTASTNGVETLL